MSLLSLFDHFMCPWSIKVFIFNITDHTDGRLLNGCVTVMILLTSCCGMKDLMPNQNSAKWVMIEKHKFSKLRVKKGNKTAAFALKIGKRKFIFHDFWLKNESLFIVVIPASELKDKSWTDYNSTSFSNPALSGEAQKVVDLEISCNVCSREVLWVAHWSKWCIRLSVSIQRL